MDWTMPTTILLAPLALAASLATGASHCSTLPEADLRALERSASRGDSDAALRLADHFFGSCANNVEEVAFWLRLAAEQRSCRGMVEWGRMLRGTGKDIEKGNWWLEEAIAAGCELPG
jgi:TPR repeat protein